MRPKCILINPWIYDFAAVNLWSRPLGLLKVAEYLSQFDIELRLIDCTDVFKIKKYGMGKYPRQIIEKPEVLKPIPRHFARYGMGINEFKEILKKNLPYDLVFVTSIMSYWYPGVQKVIELVRSLSSHTIIILGGIYATLYYEHASKYSGADFIYRGYINKGIEDELSNLGYRLKRTQPSKPYYKLGLYQRYPFTPILTSIGCPYRCSYCASPILSEKFHQREPTQVLNEIKELYEIGVRDYAFYDDALLVNTDSHLKILLKEVIKLNLNVRFHCPNGVHVRLIDDELAYLMKKSGFTTLRLGLETIDEKRQMETGGKITTVEFVSAINTLKKAGFTKEEIGVYLMYGLPDQSLEEVKEGVRFLKTLNVRINLTEFSPIPGTPCWEELKRREIINDDIDPLLTNNTVFSYLYAGYNWDELEKLKLEVKEYNRSKSCQ
jgi:radical SAM superfamily enzyme YgiQ (UPF0313 family)